MADLFTDMMHRGALGSTGAGSGGDGTYNGALSNVLAQLGIVKLKNTEGLILGTQGSGNKPIPGLGSLFAKQKEGAIEKAIKGAHETFAKAKEGIQIGGVTIGPATDMGGSSWVASTGGGSGRSGGGGPSLG